jgi:hypothetical protein
MTIGEIARKILGNYFPVIARGYRLFFVDLSAVAHSISPYITQGAIIVDIGGGDGELLNHLLALRSDIRVKMIDRSTCIGGSIKKEYLSRVELFPGISMGEFNKADAQKTDVILISDVLHHVPAEERKEFFCGLRALACGQHEMSIIIKDIEPGSLRASLSRMADRYISGDKNVTLIGRVDLSRMVSDAFGNTVEVTETNLFTINKPNYAQVYLCRN